MAGLPSGTVTFLFTDIEGSTTRWEHQPEAMRVALARHDALLRSAIEEHGGYVVKTMGDAFHAAFSRATDALAAALDAQRRLQSEPWSGIGSLRVRMALHTGSAEERGGDYYGPPLNRAARLLATGHGGQVLLSDVTAGLVRDTVPDGHSLLDLGEHRLKDLIRPERVFQVIGPGLPSGFPPLQTLDAHPNNLPVQTTPLLGREREVAGARERLLQEGVRLLTLTGPGGTGKTRLSLQVAAELVDHFADGVYLVALAPISDPALVTATIAHALEIRDIGGRPILDSLKEHLRDRQILLVLDNFEQILPAAPVVGDLLGASQRLKVLVTSRAPLELHGEYELAVSPLELPDPERLPTPAGLTQYAAVALFIERASAIKADFAITDDNVRAVAEICIRLDGLPLAIELAAARIRLLSPRAMLARLEHRLSLLTGGARDRPARHQTLRGTITWSHDLLDEQERRLFRRLSVFVGGWTFEAAETVCHVDDGDIDCLDGLDSLLTKSLMRSGDGEYGNDRFRMLETIREYAHEQLESSGELASLRRLHAMHFLALAERANIKFGAPERNLLLKRLEIEHDNLRAALTWSLTGTEADAPVTERVDRANIGLRLTVAMSEFWRAHGHFREGRQWLDTALARGDTSPTALRARAQLGAGLLAHSQADYPRAKEHLSESLGQFRHLGDTSGVAWSLSLLGHGARDEGDYGRMTTVLDEALPMFRDLDDKWGIAWTLHPLGYAARDQGDAPRAEALLTESLALFRNLQSETGAAWALQVLGLVALDQRDLVRAGALIDEAAALFANGGDKRGGAYVLHARGIMALDQGDAVRGRLLLREALTLFREVGDQRGTIQSLEGLAEIACACGQYERAVPLFGIADAGRDAMRVPLHPAERARLNPSFVSAKDALGNAFISMRAKGLAMTIDQGVAYALEDRSST